MFRCDSCGKQVERGVSPITSVVETRNVEYRRRDPETKEVLVSRGWEIAKEKRLCRDCSGVQAPSVQRGIDIDFLRSAAAVRQEHSKRCHKPLADCKQCQDNIRWFNRLPAREAAIALAVPVQRVFAMHLKEQGGTNASGLV